ncbi:unnamed protein product, partial [Laminaria digitata]
GRNRYETGSDQSADDDSYSADEVDTNQVLVEPTFTANHVYTPHRRQAKIVATPAPIPDGGGRGYSAARTQSIKRSYARFDTGVLIAVPGIPFSSDHNVPDLVNFTSAMRNAVEGVRVACDD